MRWRQKIKKHPDLFLCAACYLLALLSLLVFQLAGFVQNRLLHQNGALAATQLTVQDFELHDMVLLEDGRLVTTGYDPQMLLKDTATRVDSLTVEFSCSKDPLLLTAYYAPPRQGHSPRRMVYPAGNVQPAAFTAQQGAAATFYLPPAGGQSLRFDAGTVPGNIIEVRRIAVNQPRPFLSFFSWKPAHWLALLVLPGLAAAALSVAWQGRQHSRRPKAVSGP